MSKAYRNFKQLVKQMNEDPNCKDHGYTPEKPTMRMFRRQIHYSEKFWKGTGRLGIYWVRKRNRKTRLSKKDGWSQTCRGIWWLFRDNHLIGAVNFCKQDGMYYAHIIGTIGFKTFTLVSEAIKWTEDTTKEIYELKDVILRRKNDEA